MTQINEEILKMKILTILKKELLQSISINEFKDLTNILHLKETNLKLRDLMIEDAEKEVNHIKFENEWELLEMIEDDKNGISR